MTAFLKQLLDLYVPDGPEQRDSADAWKRCLDPNRDFLFLNASGGYRWYIDPLARKRGKPTASLRGVDRATIP